MALAAGAFVERCVSRAANYQTSAFDLGFFDQIIYNSAHGRLFQNTFVPYEFIGQHFEPILLLFVPAYWFGAGPLFLTVSQAVVVVAAAIPLYFAARRLGLNALLALAIVVSFLFNPYLHRAINFDFHPEVMVALPVFASVWAIAAGRPRVAAGIALSVLLFKEDAALVALALGVILFWSGYRRAGIATGGVAIAWALLAVLVVMPLARQGLPSDLVDRYGYLVHAQSQAGLLPALILHPWVIPAHLLEPTHLRVAALLILVTAPLAVMRPWTLLLLIPGLAVGLLASHADQARLDLHYSAEIIPLAVVGGMLGAARLKERLDSRILAVAVLAPTLIGFTWFSPLAPWNDPNHDQTASHLLALRESLALIPDDPSVSVSAQSPLVPRLSHREEIYEFPSQFDAADYVIVDHHGFIASQSVDAGFYPKLEYTRKNYRHLSSRDGVDVFRRQ